MRVLKSRGHHFFWCSCARFSWARIGYEFLQKVEADKICVLSSVGWHWWPKLLRKGRIILKCDLFLKVHGVNSISKTFTQNLNDITINYLVSWRPKFTLRANNLRSLRVRRWRSHEPQKCSTMAVFKFQLFTAILIHMQHANKIQMFLANNKVSSFRVHTWDSQLPS